MGVTKAQMREALCTLLFPDREGHVVVNEVYPKEALKFYQIEQEQEVVTPEADEAYED